ncbi:MAG: hypothetical protein KY475_12430 [Planctomycetes bacterium]|nr:hypothetical protein [Planctomycetota bacterium]
MNLTPQQLQALEKGEPVNVVVGRTRCVLVREDVYRDEAEYDAPTEEEIDLLACHAADLIQDDLDEPL